MAVVQVSTPNRFGPNPTLNVAGVSLGATPVLVASFSIPDTGGGVAAILQVFTITPPMPPVPTHATFKFRVVAQLTVSSSYPPGTDAVVNTWDLAEIDVFYNLSDPHQMYRGGGTYNFDVSGWIALYRDAAEVKRYTTDSQITGETGQDFTDGLYNPPAGVGCRVGLIGKAGGVAGARGVIAGHPFDIPLTYPAGPFGAGTLTTQIPFLLTGKVETNQGFAGSVACSVNVYDATKATAVNEILRAPVTLSGYGTAIDLSGGLSITADGSEPSGQYTSATLSGNLTRSWRLRGKLYGPDGGAYPSANSLPVHVQYFPLLYTPGPDLVLSPGTDGTFDTGLLTQQDIIWNITCATAGFPFGDGPGNSLSGSVHQQFPLKPQFAFSGLDALGEPNRDIQLQMRGDWWNAIHLAQVASQTIDPGGVLVRGGGNWSGSWVAIGGAKIADGAGDDINPAVSCAMPAPSAIPVPATPGAPTECGVSRAFTHPVWMTTYRYLHFTVRSTIAGSQPIAVRIGSKLWFAITDSTPGAWDTIEIDLCDEQAMTDGSAIPLVSTRDGVYNYLDTRLYNDEPVLALPPNSNAQPPEAPLFGVNSAASIDFIGLAGGETYEFAAITLETKETDGTISVLSPLYLQANALVNSLSPPEAIEYHRLWGAWWPTYSPQTTDWRRRIITAETDGRRSLEASDARFTLVGGNTFTPAVPIIADLIAEITSVDANGRRYWPGWSAVNLAPNSGTSFARSACLCSDQKAATLWGAGVLWQAGIGASMCVDNPYTFGTGAGTGITIPAQMVFDAVDWWPGAGDTFGFMETAPANGVTLELRAAKIFRGQAHDLLVGDGADPDADDDPMAPPPTVRLKQTVSRASGGQGVATDEAGRYATDAPYATPTFIDPGSSDIIAPISWDVIANGAPEGATGSAAAPDSSPHTPQANGVWFYPRHRRRIAFNIPGKPGVAMLADSLLGFLVRAWTTRSGVWARRSTAAIPAISADWLPSKLITASDTGDGSTFANPDLARDCNGTLRVMWEKRVPTPAPPVAPTSWARSVWTSVSIYDGTSWSAPTMVADNARYPVYGKGIENDIGALLQCYATPDPSMDGTFNLNGQFIYPGTGGVAVTGSTFVFQYLSGGMPTPLKVAISTAGYDVIQARDGGGSWLLTTTFAGDSALSEWHSTDDGITWARLPAAP